MTVLKSFDLKGNKQSFAGWISNLSPCDTPFVSMIGKESTSQAQYSWQMDALDTPKHVGYEEGSEFESEKRHPPHVTHNFTQTLRKVTHISDTVANIALYGRNSEMEYQMGKAGKELKRDMEFMCLNNDVGNIGTKTLASKFSGFLPLCAPKGYIDQSTGAETYKEVNVADLNGPWFKKEDLFDLTYNLYLAGSKANKIMFHPHHATTFSDFMSQSVETAHTYRMFKGLDTEFNAQVSKIRDPLAQVYDLIPNRFMPKDKIYIFNESDWTQMILRQPSASKLGKQGSSERFLLETEVGLRHRHVNASGVMAMKPSTLEIEWVDKPTPLTAGINHTEDATVRIKDRATGNLVPDTTTFVWASSNLEVVSLLDPTGHTADGIATVHLIPEKAGTSIITVSSEDGFASYLVTVGYPDIRLTISTPVAEKQGPILLIANVKQYNGHPVKNGTPVNFFATPSTMAELDAVASGTIDGVASVGGKALNVLGHVQFQCRVGETWSNFIGLEIKDKVKVLAMDITNRTLAVDINDSSEIEVIVVDGKGAGIMNELVDLVSSDTSVIELSRNRLTTGAQGSAILVVTPKGVGTTVIKSTFEDQSLEMEVTVGAPRVTLQAPSPVVMGGPFNMTATVRRSDGSNPGVGAEVSFTSDPAFSPAVSDVTTGIDGTALATYTPMGNSDLEITASVGAYKSQTLTVTVNDSL